MKILLGIDLGTSSLKTVVLTENGTVLSSNAVDYQFNSPRPGYAEQDPDVWYDACVRTIRAALSIADIHPNAVTAVGFSGQMHGVVMLDHDYRPVRPAILHCDARSGDEAAALKGLFSSEEQQRLFRNPIYPGFMLTSLLWVKNHEPDVFDKIAHVCSPKDYVRFRLCGEFSSEFSDASATLLYDFDADNWSDEIIRRAGLPREVFPRCYEPTDIVGTICGMASADTGLPESVLVASGGSDVVMMSTGNGMVHNGDAALNIGSSGQASFQIDRPVINNRLNTNMFTAYHSGRWILFGATMSAGLCLKWWRRITGNPSYEAIKENISKIAPGSGGLIFYPYLNGERCPHIKSDISSCFLGANASTTYWNMTRAVMEGVSYSLRQCAETCAEMGMSAESYVFSGGGARSDEWTQMMADIVNKPCRRIIGEEQACMGAAMTAGVGCGLWKNIPEAVSVVVKYQPRVFIPDPRSVDIYEEYYSLYRDTFPQFVANLQKLTNLGRR